MAIRPRRPFIGIRVGCMRILTEVFPVVELAGDVKRDVPVKSPVSLTISTSLAVPSSSHDLISLQTVKAALMLDNPVRGTLLSRGDLEARPPMMYQLEKSIAPLLVLPLPASPISRGNPLCQVPPEMDHGGHSFRIRRIPCPVDCPGQKRLPRMTVTVYESTTQSIVRYPQS